MLTNPLICAEAPSHLGTDKMYKLCLLMLVGTQIRRSEFFLPSDLLLNGLCVSFSEQVEHGAAEVVRVAVWVPQLISNSIEEQIAT